MIHFNNSNTLEMLASQSFSKNQGKAYFAFLSMSICTFVMVTLAASLQNTLGLFFTGFFMVIVLASIFLFQYGFAVVITRLYTGQRTVLGHLFNGFRDFKRGAPVGAFIALVYVVCSFAVVFIAMPIIMPIVEQSVHLSSGAENAGSAAAQAVLTNPRFSSLIWVMAGMYIVLCVFVLFRYIFAWYFLAADTEIRPVQALRASRRILKGNWLKTVFFCLKRGGYPLIAAAAALALSIADMYVEIPAFIAGISSFAYTVCYAVAFTRMSFALAAVFYHLAPQNLPSLPEAADQADHSVLSEASNSADDQFQS